MNLVIRGADVETRMLKELAKLTGASAIEQVEPNVFRLKNASQAAGVEALCAARNLTFSFVPEQSA